MNQKTIWLIVVAIVITAILVGSGTYFWQQSETKKLVQETKKEFQHQITLLQKQIKELKKTRTKPEENSYLGWLIYKNEIYGYEFRYPKGAHVREAKKEEFRLSPEEANAGITIEDVYNKYTGKICISIIYDLGYIYISAPSNKGNKYVLCGRTGRAYEGPSKTEEITIEGRKWIAKGFEEQGPGETLNYHNETLAITLNDGTRIEYGSRPVKTATFADYLKMKGEIIKIIESFKRI